MLYFLKWKSLADYGKEQIQTKLSVSAVSGGLGRKLPTGRTVICPAGALMNFCSLLVTMIP